MTRALGAGRPQHAPTGAAAFWVYVSRLIRHPRRAWPQLLADPARLRYGFRAVLLVGLGYALVAWCIALAGGTPSPPWLAIPRAEYFR